ncbi:MAG: hypothetical protein LC650_04850, partial [Actinobacteria bacterium]|nr:hypothetical protein [Actinomycetota bacterium]
FREHQYKPKTAWEQTKNIIIPEGLRKVPKSNVPVYGSQCIYFPRGYVKFLLDEMTYAVQYTKKVKAQPTRAMDSAVNDFRDNHRLDSYIYLPHPVQHLQNRTRRKGSSLHQKSLTFDMVSDKESNATL